MLEYFIVPGALAGFLFTWMLAEEATKARVANRAPKLPTPEPTPAPVQETPVRHRFWFF